MRWLAALLALSVAVPTVAEDDKPAWVGVWEGRVGNSPVRLCMDVWGDTHARGAYYYLSQLEPISLSEADGEGGWIERYGDEEAEWNFTELSGTAMRGNWRRLRVVHPFALTPVPWSKGEWDGPCDSVTFMAPRLGGGTVADEPAELNGWRYTRRTYRPPAHFTDEMKATSFAFAPERPGDRAILDWLDGHVPKGTMDDASAECVAGAIASVGSDGYFEEIVVPTMVSRSFLIVRENSDTYCGGAHPNAYYQHFIFDRDSGAKVDLFGWLNDKAREHRPADTVGDSYDTVLPDLRKLIVKHDPSEGVLEDEEFTEEEGLDEECRDVAESQEFWTLGVSRDGMLFVPSVPHVATVCMATYTVPWRELTPFLSAEGRAGVARLRAD
jgi:hypothetical protein